MSVAPSDGATDRPRLAVAVGGPLCESGDILTRDEGGFVSTRQLLKANIGDLLIIECTGAYGFAMGSNYSSKPFAAEILMHNDNPHPIRQRQTLEDLIRGQSIPELD